MGANFSKFITAIRTSFGCADWFNLKNLPDPCWTQLSKIQKAEVGMIIWFLVTTVLGVIFVVGEFLIGGEGFLEDIFSFFGDFESIFEWLSSFIESAFGYLLIGGGYLLNLFMEFANSMALSTGTPPAIWIFLGVLGIFWAASYVIQDVMNESVNFKSSSAYPWFYAMNLPVHWVIEGITDVLGSWAGTIAQVFALPINIVIIILSEILGLLWSVITGFF